MSWHRNQELGLKSRNAKALYMALSSVDLVDRLKEYESAFTPEVTQYNQIVKFFLYSL